MEVVSVGENGVAQAMGSGVNPDSQLAGKQRTSWDSQDGIEAVETKSTPLKVRR